MFLFIADQIGLTPEEVISKIMANPEVAMAFQNPKVQAAIMDVSQNWELLHSVILCCTVLPFVRSDILFLQCSQDPQSIIKYQNDKEVRTQMWSLYPIMHNREEA